VRWGGRGEALTHAEACCKLRPSLAKVRIGVSHGASVTETVSVLNWLYY